MIECAQTARARREAPLSPRTVESTLQRLLGSIPRGHGFLDSREQADVDLLPTMPKLHLEAAGDMLGDGAGKAVSLSAVTTSIVIVLRDRGRAEIVETVIASIA